MWPNIVDMRIAPTPKPFSQFHYETLTDAMQVSLDLPLF
jgi:hypothetical protein